VLFGGVSGQEDGIAAEGFDLGAEVFEAVFAAGGDDEASSAVGESAGGGVADAGAGSGDNSYLADGRARGNGGAGHE
jgi:hypothetical protein